MLLLPMLLLPMLWPMGGGTTGGGLPAKHSLKSALNIRLSQQLTLKSQ
jgi:hypothetical protein